MNKVTIIQVIVKAYFFAAIAISFTHLIEAARKGGLTGYEAFTVPFMIDGLAIIGLTMRGAGFNRATRQLGFKVQLGAGALSLAGNVYAAHNVGGAVYGFAIVFLFVFSEWLSDNVQAVGTRARKR